MLFLFVSMNIREVTVKSLPLALVYINSSVDLSEAQVAYVKQLSEICTSCL